MLTKPSLPLDIRKYTNGIWSTEHGFAPAETPLLLTVNGEPWLEFMCTPEYLEALAAGFLYNEGLIESASEIAQLRVCQARDNVDVWTVNSIEKPIRWRRTSGCTGGITAGNSLESQNIGLPKPPHGISGKFDMGTLAASQINGLVMALMQAQSLHRQIGGIHSSAISDECELLLFCEDIGRHNTMDKLAGRVLLEKVVAPRRAILTTGRISSEMLQKAVRMGIAFVVSLTAPTSMAVQLAEYWGITLIGYAHSERFKIYAHPERVEMK
jgi:FdhD protein